MLCNMNQTMTALERAFELAKSGKCDGVSDIKKMLKSEGYSLSQIEGGTLRKQLSALIKAAKADADTQPQTGPGA